MEKVNRPSEVNQAQECRERKPWQSPVMEEMLVNETENVIRGTGADLGIYASS